MRVALVLSLVLTAGALKSLKGDLRDDKDSKCPAEHPPANLEAGFSTPDNVIHVAYVPEFDEVGPVLTSMASVLGETKDYKVHFHIIGCRATKRTLESIRECWFNRHKNDTMGDISIHACKTFYNYRYGGVMDKDERPHYQRDPMKNIKVVNTHSLIKMHLHQYFGDGQRVLLLDARTVARRSVAFLYFMRMNFWLAASDLYRAPDDGKAKANWRDCVPLGEEGPRNPLKNLGKQHSLHPGVLLFDVAGMRTWMDAVLPGILSVEYNCPDKKGPQYQEALMWNLIESSVAYARMPWNAVSMGNTPTSGTGSDVKWDFMKDEDCFTFMPENAALIHYEYNWWEERVNPAAFDDWKHNLPHADSNCPALLEFDSNHHGWWNKNINRGVADALPKQFR